MKTGSHLKIKSYGDAVLGVTLEGNPKKPEPIHFRITFPFGDVDIVRCSDSKSYWVHIRKNTAEDMIGNDDLKKGDFIDARLDCKSKHAIDLGDFNSEDMYHLAVKIGELV